MMAGMMIEAALRAVVLAGIVWIALATLRVRNVPARKTAWSLVLIASLAMPLLMRWQTEWGTRHAWMVPLPKIGLNEQQQPALSSSAETADESAATAMVPAVWPVKHKAIAAVVAEPYPIAETSTEHPRRFASPPVRRMLEWVYMGVAGALLLRLIYGLIAAWRLWATADEVSPLVAPEGAVRASKRIASPVTIGSGVVLPADYLTWERKKLRMVIAHEGSHVRQLDFYLQSLASLYTALFWFSPLGWLLRRSLASLGETIADRAGIDAGASRSGYAALVLEFAAMPRTNLQGVAMARPGNLSRRIDWMLNESMFRRAFAEGRHRARLVLLLIPAAVFAVTALMRVPAADAQAAPPPPLALAPAVSEVAPAPMAVPAAAQPAPKPSPAVPAQTAPAPAPPASPAAHPNVPEERTGTSNAEAMEADDATIGDSDDEDAWALVRGPGSKAAYFGSWNQSRRAEIDAARRGAHGPFLWFVQDGKAYVIDDPATVSRIAGMIEPMNRLGAQQEALGKQQQELGRQMQQLAEDRQAQIKVRMPDLSRQMADIQAAMERFDTSQMKWNTEDLKKLEAKIQAEQGQLLSPEKIAEIEARVAAVQVQLNPERMAEVQAKIAAMEARLGALQGEMGARQGDFGMRMGELGSQQGKLGAEQGRLGAEQARLARDAQRQMRQIIDEALRSHKATLVPRLP